MQKAKKKKKTHESCVLSPVAGAWLAACCRPRSLWTIPISFTHGLLGPPWLPIPPLCHMMPGGLAPFDLRSGRRCQGCLGGWRIRFHCTHTLVWRLLPCVGRTCQETGPGKTWVFSPISPIYTTFTGWHRGTTQKTTTYDSVDNLCNVCLSVYAPFSLLCLPSHEEGDRGNKNTWARRESLGSLPFQHKRLCSYL